MIKFDIFYILSLPTSFVVGLFIFYKIFGLRKHFSIYSVFDF